MGYLIIPNNFAPKDIRNEFNGDNNSHAILVNYCNFNCSFCAIDYADSVKYKAYSSDEFEEIVKELLPRGNAFKFSGGEQLMNKELKRDLQIIKKLGGKVYLDTNGSKVDVLKELIDCNLVDVLGISLKGLSAKDAKIYSGIDDATFCWDNVLNSIIYSAQKGVCTIVTLVCFQGFCQADIETFAQIFEGQNVFLKFNNYKKKRGCITSYEPCNSRELNATICNFVEKNPQWKNRIIIIDNEEAVHMHNKITFL